MASILGGLTGIGFAATALTGASEGAALTRRTSDACLLLLLRGGESEDELDELATGSNSGSEDEGCRGCCRCCCSFGLNLLLHHKGLQADCPHHHHHHHRHNHHHHHHHRLGVEVLLPHVEVVDQDHLEERHDHHA